MDCLQSCHPQDCRNVQHLQVILGCQDHAHQPDGNPCEHARLQDGRRQQRQLCHLVGGVDCQLRGHARRHPRISEDSGRNDCFNAGLTTVYAAVLHGTAAAAPPRYLRSATATAWPLQISALQFSRQRGQI